MTNTDIHVPTANYTKVPNQLILDHEMSDGAFRYYCALLMIESHNRALGYSGLNHSNNQLASILGVSHKTIETYNKELRELGYLRVVGKDERIEVDGLWRTNATRILDHEKPETATP